MASLLKSVSCEDKWEICVECLLPWLTTHSYDIRTMCIVICIELEECEWEGIILKPRKKPLHIFIKVMIIDFMSILSFIT